MAAAQQARRTGRKRGIPAAPPPRAAFGSLAATSSDPLSLALFRCTHKVLLWAGTPAERRPALFRRVSGRVREHFAAAIDAAPVLADALAIFLEMQEAPGTVDPKRVALACHWVWEWGERRGYLAVATHYAEAAAYADPTNPTWAVVAGYMTRKSGGPDMWARSSVWHARAGALAVRTKNRPELVRAHTGMGALFKDMGRPNEALAEYREAARRSARGSRRAAAVVEHYIFALCVDYGWTDEAIPHAVRAFDLYPLKDDRLPYLAHDIAVMLLGMRFARLALHVLDAAAARMARPHDMGLLFGTIAQAAGAVGRAARYATAERAMLDLVDVDQEHAGAALARLAEGARALRDWERAERHARESLRVARRRHDREQARETVALLRAVLRREGAPVVETPPEGSPVAMLARRVAARLRRASRAPRRSPTVPGTARTSAGRRHRCPRRSLRPWGTSSRCSSLAAGAVAPPALPRTSPLHQSAVPIPWAPWMTRYTRPAQRAQGRESPFSSFDCPLSTV
jgi:tetratricopeptide (TPR) repeat protein